MVKIFITCSIIRDIIEQVALTKVITYMDNSCNLYCLKLFIQKNIIYMVQLVNRHILIIHITRACKDDST